MPAATSSPKKNFAARCTRILREALDYIRRNYISETVIKHHDRAEATRVENFPYPAIEEAVVNAIYHRSYEVREPVEVRISRDELVVLSYPGPDRSVRLDQLRAGKAISRRYRNRRIGEFLKELEFTEGRSTGIPKINRAMRENGSPRAEFEFDEDHSYFMVRLPVQPDAPRVNLSGTLVGGRQATPHDTHHVTPHVMRVLEACQQPSTRRELQSALSLLDRVHFREKYLGPAISAGFLEMTNPEKPASKLQRYRLTPQGLVLLHASQKPQVTDLSGPESGLESRPESGPESGPESATSRKVLAALPGGAPVTPPVTPPVNKMLELLADEGELGNAEIRERLRLKDRTHLRQHYIEPALTSGLIEYTIPDKPNSRLQKYRLTKKGRARLAAKHSTDRTRPHPLIDHETTKTTHP